MQAIAKTTKNSQNISNLNNKNHSNREKSALRAIVLAGGEGTRLKSLTRRISGDERPKQFCPLLGNESILSKTRNRLALKIEDKNTFFVLTNKHEKFYKPILNDVTSERLIIQPENKGTAVAILYALQRLAVLNSHSTVAIFPSDHFIKDEPKFMDYVETAYLELEDKRDSIILLGVEPDTAECEYGWIEPAKGNPNKSLQVVNFWEKPSETKAQELLKSDCLWNSFVMIGNVSNFLELFNKTIPKVYAEFARFKYTMNTCIEHPIFFDIYKNIPVIDFSKEILAKNIQGFQVLPIKNVGWNDLGKPHRVFQSLDRLDSKPFWLEAA